MNYRFYAKKLGDNWYLDVRHTDPVDIQLNEKISKVFNVLDKSKSGCLEILLFESYSFVPDNSVYINEEDILRYFTTEDEFNIRFIVFDKEFSISSNLYYLLECQYNTNFHKTLYTIEIRN